MGQFCHLHCHTQYSLLDGASDIGKLMDKAVADGQKGIALTDHGNMFGAFKFVAEAHRRHLKPIIGCEFYLVEDRFRKSFSRSRGEKDVRYHQLLLAKNFKGYQNLSRLCSFGFIDGLYQKYPRIDKSLLEKFHEGIIATSCCLGAEIPSLIAGGQLEKAEKELKWWLNMFGEDYYIELQRHRGLDKLDNSNMSQEDVNQVLLGFAKKYNIKTIATNDVHYVDENDWKPHDILLCVNTNSLIKDENRFKFSSSDYYLKTTGEMQKLFADVPEAVDNTMEIYGKIDSLDLAREVLLPAFPVPQAFKNQEDYLKHLCFLGAKERYGTLTQEIEERLNFELHVINNSGYAGYFLIVQDLTNTARKLGVAVGPGRGSAAGSVVAYCLRITNIDPIKYDLLFERFLNPERISMPDIDIDFDDEGRSRVIDYVIDKYGKNQVAQIITYGTMAAKLSIRDVGRVMNIPLNEVDRVTKMFPGNLGATLNKVLKDGDIDTKLKENLNKEDLDKAYQFRKMAQQGTEIGKMITNAQKLEGSIRNTGIHACGVIITPDDIMNYIPVTVAKGSDLLVSQFDNNVAEDAGLLKMDFLGLKTLSILKETVEHIENIHGVKIDLDAVPLDDQKTFELFQKGETIAIFQYESVGMQKNLIELKPNKFEDLIAMNALYRPGPMKYIPDFVARKHGKQKITYDLPEMEEYLRETYGITVYQEQVMLLSQKLAGFTKGEADQLRKAMGKKKKKIIDQMYPKFLEGCKANNHPEEVVEKIWKDWEAFASYAFNKSHSTCYAFLGFQTAYLKAHYPSEFMASFLNHKKSDVDTLNFYLRECKRMRIKVHGPNINLSHLNFTVNQEGNIRFGLSALKGVGEGPVNEILAEREKEGPFKSIFDITRRVNQRTVNKKCLESLALSGSLDDFGITRARYFETSLNFETLIEHAIRYGHQYQDQKEKNVISLFGDITDQILEEPDIEPGEEWIKPVKLEKEKEVTGIYISGHPLDDYRMELQNYINCDLENVHLAKNAPIRIAGLITEVNHGVSQKGLGYARFTIQDYMGSFSTAIFNEDYEKYKDILTKGQVIFIEGRYQTYSKSTRTFFKIKDLRLLAGLSEELTRSITVRVPIETIDGVFIDRLKNICNQHTGNHEFKLQVFDLEENLDLNLKATKYKVTVDSHFIDQLSELGLKYRLN